MAQTSKFEDLPRPILLIGVFVVGLVFFYLFQKPHTLCDSQLDQFKASESGVLFSHKSHDLSHAAVVDRAAETCKLGRASPGACYEYFHYLRGLIVQLQSINSECGPDLMDIQEVKHALTEGLILMTQMAWGDEPPEKMVANFGPLQTPELALFCQLKEALLRYGTPEDWLSVQNAALQKLPGETRKFEKDQDGKNICSNCQDLPSAEKAFGREEALARSLLRLHCERLFK